MKLNDICEEDITEIADSSAIIARGLDYYEDGCITSFRVENERIIAKVRGNDTYDVEISIDEDEIDASCNCPYDGYGCKHIVAVLYKWIDEKDKVKSGIKFKKKNKGIEIKGELAKLDKQNLIELVSEFVDNYEDVKRDLLIKLTKEDSVASFPAKEIVLGQIKEVLYSRGDFISYREMPSVVRKLDEIKDAILKYPPKIRAYLLEELSKNCIEAEEHSDDSDGDLGMLVEECLGELGKAIHEQELTFEEKKSLILKNLDNLEDDDYGFEHGYFDLLVEIPETREEFEYLINEINQRMMRMKKDYEKGIYEDLLIELYKRANIDDKYLEALNRNAENEGEYFALVEYWKSKGNVEKAVEIAERGLKKGKSMFGRDDRLYEFLESVYSSQDKKELLKIMLLHFKERPSLSKYKDIAALCRQPEKWDKIKARLIRDAKGQVLIDIYLFENEYDKAYDKLMGSFNEYVDTFKDKVAKALLEKYPDKSLKIYLAIVDEFLDRSSRESYKVAAMYTKKVKDIMINRLSMRPRWESYIVRIRDSNRRRPALIEEFKKI